MKKTTYILIGAVVVMLLMSAAMPIIFKWQLEQAPGFEIVRNSDIPELYDDKTETIVTADTTNDSADSTIIIVENN